MESMWKGKYRTLAEFYANEYDPAYYEFTQEELTIDPDAVRRMNAFEDFTVEQQVEEIKKCSDSFPYFCHKYIKIAHPKYGILPFILYKYQRRVIREYESHRFNIISKFRQGGLTTVTVLWGLWRAMFRENEFIFLASKTDREAIVAGQIADRALEYLPSWLQPELSTNSKHEKIFTDTGTGFFFYTPEAIRGRAITYLFIDEAAFIPEMDRHWKAMYPVVSTGGNVIAVSTVNGVGNWYEETFHGAQDGTNPFHIIELEYQEHPDYNDDKWMRETRAILGEKGWLQEVLRQFLGSGDTFIKPDIIAELVQHTSDIEPARKLFPEWNNQDEIRDLMMEESKKNNHRFEDWDKGALWVFQEAKIGGEYIIGVDVAEGIGDEGDNSCFEVIDAVNMIQVAEFYSNSVPTHDLAHIVAMVGNMYNRATVVVENMGPGKAVLDCLIHTLKYENVHYQDMKKPGIKVGTQNRSVVLDAIQNALLGRKLIIHSKRLVKELKTFIFDPRRKRPEAMNGKHDDAIFAMAHALHVRGDIIRSTPYGAESLVKMDDPMSSETYQKIKEELSKGAPEDWLDWEQDLKPLPPEEQFISDFAQDYERKNNKLLKEFGW